MPPVNEIRAKIGVAPVASADEFFRRAPLLLVATGKPFMYPDSDWGDSVQMIGPCVFEPPADIDTGWLDDIDRPIVLVTTSSERQAYTNLVTTAMDALADEPLHLFATFPAGMPDGVTSSSNVTL